MILVLEYPKCSTCKKALKWLEENEVSFTKRHIVEENPSEQELTEWYHKSGLPLFAGVFLNDMALCKGNFIFLQPFQRLFRCV